MPHQRQVIRHAIAGLLRGRTAAGPRVDTSRVDPHRKGKLPAISVYTLGEQSDVGGSALRELTRELKVEIAGWVAHGPVVDDEMDALADEIEAVMDADQFLGGAAVDSVLESTEMFIGNAAESDPIVGIVTLTYSVIYRTGPDPVTLDDFRSADVTTRIDGADDSNAAHDQFVVQQEIP